ncbi:DUF465 domain-containing protein [Sphingomonas parva]|uniref:DUF465 domain-containing protein n=1 Tax=Sphingomonas parva TaxID=2555898 RepID=A0A4Y8ZNA7_9SPHN|nr:DUF465 domain-containing protein [Sphingomonas parva]TFI57488.1 DUF465 domain-containing protein [Sphingomonas parva]
MNIITYRLTLIHRKLDEEISRELKRRIPDWMRLLRLKKLRLAVKDRLHRHAPLMMRRPGPALPKPL